MQRSISMEEFHRREVINALRKNESLRQSMAYSLAMASEEVSDFPAFSKLSPRMKEQLRISKTQLNGMPIRMTQSGLDERPLPRTLEEALRPSSRAIVITDTIRPFRVCDVNRAWEDLCGYSYLESKGKSLGDLLKGPETDPLAVTTMVNRLLHGEDATIVLTNYTKSGRKFRNRLQVGPLFNDRGEVTNYVGVLQEVSL